MTDAPARPADSPSTLVTVVLSGLAPGTGHVHAGAPLRGLLLLLLITITALAWAEEITTSRALALGLAWPPALLVLYLVADSGMVARRARSRGLVAKPLQRWWAYLVVALLSVVVMPTLVAARVSANCLVATEISDDLAPTTAAGDVVIVDRRAWRSSPPVRGQIALVSLPDGTRVLRRLAALPGEDVEIRLGVVSVGGRETAADYRLPLRLHELFLARTHLAEDQYLVLSDVRRSSEKATCRIGRGQLLGRASWIAWPGDLEPARVGKRLP